MCFKADKYKFRGVLRALWPKSGQSLVKLLENYENYSQNPKTDPDPTLLVLIHPQ